ncbi:IscS subfamily cysteine desulfurase [Runella sp.]|uniref:IscS subfamily cysteine desulfurase n=1 Tax=Runella sp. TaxID=1960881 RepID=UPI00261D842E|nr:IscS subfamily cysteine desulfurase [Runella sp.]
MRLPVYLDYNATTPVDQRVLTAMLPWFTEQFGNAASRTHLYGWTAEEAVAQARKQVAKLLNANPKEIVFTSGATEANNLAIKGVFEKLSYKGRHIVTVATEHKAVLDTCHHLEQLGAEVTYLTPSADGLITPEQLAEALRKETILVSVMYANNEIGVIQPIRELAAVTHQAGALFHTDATQAVGKLPLDVQAEGIDLLSLSAHKLYGPKGIGALYVRQGIEVVSQMDGGGHERGRRSGTLNVPAIVGLGKACELAQKEMKTESERLRQLRDRLESAVLENVPDTFVNGSATHRLSHLTNICFEHIDGENLLLNLKDIAVSTGSACTSASVLPSYVLKMLGLSDDQAYASLRFSLGRFTTDEEIDFAIQHIGEVVRKMRMDVSYS